MTTLSKHHLMKRKVFAPGLITLFVFLCSFTYINFIKRTKGFSVKKILSEHSYSQRWDFGPPTPEQEALLDQISSEPYTLIGSGKECYAFVNESGTTVIKFFKQKHMRTQSILSHIPMAKQFKMILQETINRRTHHRNRIFTSYQIAYEQLPEQTGVLYLHLNKTKNLKRPILIIEPGGREHSLELDEMEFLIQKRAHPIFETLNTLMREENLSEAKATILSILDLIDRRHALGIGDDDNNCERNFGLIEGKAVHIDVGEFYLSVPQKPKRAHYSQATDDLKRFLELRYPILASFLESEIEKRCIEIL